jgi:hypothetical protein
MNISHGFKLTLSYKYTCSKEELNKVLGVGDNTSIPWIKAFSDVFGTPTSSYDGYIHDVIINDDTILIDAYIIEDATKFSRLRELAEDSWKLVLTYLIKLAIVRNAEAIKQLKSVSIMNFKYISTR